MVCNGEGLDGTIPHNIGKMTDLTRLDLSQNGITGPVPPSIGELTKLTDLRLAHNQLIGTVPPGQAIECAARPAVSA